MRETISLGKQCKSPTTNKKGLTNYKKESSIRYYKDKKWPKLTQILNFKSKNSMKNYSEQDAVSSNREDYAFKKQTSYVLEI